MPVIVSPEPEAPHSNEPSTAAKPRRGRRRNDGASIELEIDRIVVRMGRDVDADAIATVISALKAAS